MANQIRLEGALHDGSFLLVEGSSDANLFRKFCDADRCSIIVCIGRKNLIEAITILENSGFRGALGLADKDFSDLIGYPAHKGSVVYSDENDIEIMILCSPALENVLREFGVKDRVNAVEASGKDVCDLIFEAASFCGAFRYLSKRDSWYLKFSGMTYRFNHQSSFKLDKLRTVQHVVSRSQKRPKETEVNILKLIKIELDRIEEKKSLCCGHDCVRILGRALQRELGNTNKFNNPKGAETLERVLRLVYCIKLIDDI